MKKTILVLILSLISLPLSARPGEEPVPKHCRWVCKGHPLAGKECNWVCDHFGPGFEGGFGDQQVFEGQGEGYTCGTILNPDVRHSN